MPTLWNTQQYMLVILKLFTLDIFEVTSYYPVFFHQHTSWFLLLFELPDELTNFALSTRIKTPADSD